MRAGAWQTVPITLVLGGALASVGTSGARAQTQGPDSAEMPPTIVVTATAPDDTKPRRIGGGVSAPVLLHSANPEYSDEARRAKISGNVLLNLWVDESGNPTHIKVLRGVGYGLDEKAVEAIRQYRFKPAQENGTPVVVEINVQVNFQTFKDRAEAEQAMAGNTPGPTPGPTSGPTSGLTPRASASGPSRGGGAGSGGSGSGVLNASTSAANGGLKTIGDQKLYQDNAKFRQAFLETKAPNLTSDERLARWKHANKLAENQCVLCLHTIVSYQQRAGQWKDLIATAKQLDAIGPDAKDKYVGESQWGMALMHMNGDHPKPEQLQEALTELRAAIALSEGNQALQGAVRNSIYTEGRALAMLGRDAEASAAFQSYVDHVGYSDAYRTRAEHFVDNPKLASMPMAPPFTLTTVEGEQISLDDMGGKVVLLDFWATWCGPCKETLPVIQRMAKTFAGQPLVVVSISGDSDDRAWRAFIDKNGMTWPQYRDANGSLRVAYGVTAIPQFFTIDTDGVLQSVKVGSDADVEGDIRRLVKKATDAEKKKAKASEHASAGL